MMRFLSFIIIVVFAGLMCACWSSNYTIHTGPPPRTTPLDSAKKPIGTIYVQPPDSLDVSFEVPGDTVCPVMIKLKNIATQTVRVIVDSAYSPGRYTVRWDAADSSGAKLKKQLYFYKFYICDQTRTLRMDYRIKTH
jgi:hypothetical protein